MLVPSLIYLTREDMTSRHGYCNDRNCYGHSLWPRVMTTRYGHKITLINPQSHWCGYPHVV